MKPRNKKRSNDKQGRKKVSKSQRRKTQKNVGKRSPNRAQKTHSKPAKRTQLVSKAKAKAKIHIQSKPVRKSGNKPKVAHAKARIGTPLISHPRQKQIIIISFRGAKTISKKLKSVEKSLSLNKAVGKQLKRKGGKPPRAVVISTMDKNGVAETIVSKPSLVITEKSVKALVVKLLKGEKKFKHSQYGSFDELFDPDKIAGINIRFVYKVLNTKK